MTWYYRIIFATIHWHAWPRKKKSHNRKKEREGFSLLKSHHGFIIALFFECTTSHHRVIQKCVQKFIIKWKKRLSVFFNGWLTTQQREKKWWFIKPRYYFTNLVRWLTLMIEWFVAEKKRWLLFFIMTRFFLTNLKYKNKRLFLARHLFMWLSSKIVK